MRRIRLFGVFLLIPALACTFIAAGCGGKKGDGERKHRSTRHDDDDEKDDDSTGDKKGGSEDAGGGKTLLASNGWGAIKGQVTLDGSVPEGASFVDKMNKHKDKARCLKGPKHDQTWLVATKGGKKVVQNVVVWLDPGEGKYFKVDPAKKTWKDEVDIDQPFCAFQPRVQAVCPSYWDGKKDVKLQTFVAKNSAPIAHNTKWQGGDRTNPGGNPLIAPSAQAAFELKPDTKTVITLSCTIHDWMRGKVWALPNPYYAVTDADGKFEIKNAPAGAEVKLIAWHEAGGFIKDKDLPKGGKVKVEDGKDAVMDFSIKP
jgi:hypothetical protein